MVRAEDTSAEHVAECQALWDKSGGFHNAGPFTPFGFQEEGDAAEEHDSVSGRHRRRELGRRGRGSDDRLRLRQRARHVARRLDRGEAPGPELRQRRRRDRRMPYDRGSVNGAGPYFTLQRAAQGRERPHARESAVPASAMGRAWSRSTPTPARSPGRAPLGLTEALPEGKQLTGNSGSAGPTVDRRRPGLRRRDHRSPLPRVRLRRPARSCGSTRLDAQVNANPMTYRGKNGKQYVAVVATDTLVAFALP